MTDKHTVEMQRDEHDAVQRTKRVSLVSAATIYAVTSAVLDVGDIEIGAVELKDHDGTDRAAVTSDNDLQVTLVGEILNSLATVTQAGAIDIDDISSGTQTNDVKITLDSEAVVLGAGLAKVGFATVAIGSAATINAVVNTAAAGQASVVIDTGKNWVGLATVVVGSAATINAVVNTAAAGQASVVIDTGKNWVGLATVVIGSAATINAVVNTAAAGQASVVLDSSENWIGLATVTVGNTVTVDATGSGDIPITLDSEAVALGAGLAGIGFATVYNAVGASWMGLVSVSGSVKLGANSGVDVGDVDVTSLPALVAGEDYIGLATIDIGSAPTLNVLPKSNVTVSMPGGATVYQGTAVWNSLGTVSLGASIPAGTAAIGKLAANSGVDIGDVDVLSIAAGVNYIGQATVRVAAGASYIGLATVNLGAGIAGIGFATVSTAAGASWIGLTTTVLGGSVAGIGFMTINGGKLSLIPVSTGGCSIFRSIDLDETEEEVHGVAGQIYGYFLANTNATVARYVKFYNTTAANTSVGVNTPIMTLPLQAQQAANADFEVGIPFGTALSVAATTGVADTDTGAPATNDIIANIFYK